ncbi:MULTISPECIES: ABC transporter ATP-binding protein [Streptomyces]|uniref:ABC-type xenobiotic transporter n=1 Tax=Streptomyces albus (strain ATCC 21838 / DSM 41398 / FERM P-419 / JCM 4703 / NBRC 107858) TaxID=1081613 RepID=A0A0B5EGR8_STRA4|nr:ABC transporter ATP-binding protein [Streptomyces sp. SCSIO ZS0520]AJE81313.1 nodulation ABC transporter NodI [Streptomyces albus]AOU75628.1 nodulation ABC transporter NodI [Streptomyces albus]AYN31432.1 ABC transporter ATP-binding protein [Streptomyces albus]
MTAAVHHQPVPPAEGDAAIHVREVRKSYGAHRAVDGVSLDVRHGEFFGLLGPNGAGKTTLVEIMEGLREADSGEITVLGQSPWPRNTALLPRMGVQTQSSAFFVRQTAREHLVTVAALYRAGAAAADRSLETVGLGSQRDTLVENLSGGQRQRLAIASALVHGPELIFLDEPTAALDPQARRDLWEVLRTLKGEGRTIVYTTHHLDEAEALCDRVAILMAGRVRALDSPHELVSATGAPSRLMLPAGRLSPEKAAEIPGVDRASVQGGSLVLETAATGKVLQALDTLTGLDGVMTRTATLEDVYLELTGAPAPDGTSAHHHPTEQKA